MNAYMSKNSHINEFLYVDGTRMDECRPHIRIHSCGCFFHVERLINNSHINEFLYVNETRMDGCHPHIRMHSCGCFFRVDWTDS